MTEIEAVLRALARDLAARKVGWALIGGLAVSVRTEPRFTRDVDVAIAVADDRSAERLLGDLLFASSGVEVELVTGAEPREIFQGLVVPVASVGLLIAPKLLSESDAGPQDRQDLSALMAQATRKDLDQARAAARWGQGSGADRNP